MQRPGHGGGLRVVLQDGGQGRLGLLQVAQCLGLGSRPAPCEPRRGRRGGSGTAFSCSSSVCSVAQGPRPVAQVGGDVAQVLLRRELDPASRVVAHSPLVPRPGRVVERPSPGGRGRPGRLRPQSAMEMGRSTTDRAAPVLCRIRLYAVDDRLVQVGRLGRTARVLPRSSPGPGRPRRRPPATPENSLAIRPKIWSTRVESPFAPYSWAAVNRARAATVCRPCRLGLCAAARRLPSRERSAISSYRRARASHCSFFTSRGRTESCRYWKSAFQSSRSAR